MKRPLYRSRRLGVQPQRIGQPAIWLCTLLLCACSTPGARTEIDVRAAPAVAGPVQVGREVGLLLGAEPEVSSAAEERLITRTGAAKDELLTFARRIPKERDPRWLNVMDEHHALPTLGDEARVDFLIWKGARDEGAYAMRSQARLVEIARERPELLIERIEQGGVGTDRIALALAQAGVRDAVPALLEQYTSPSSDLARRAAAEALTQLAGERLRPRARGRTRGIVQDAARIRAWYDEQRAVALERAQREKGSPQDG